MLSEDARRIINSSTVVGFPSETYPGGYEYLCVRNGKIYHIVDDGTPTGIVSASKPIQLDYQAAVQVLDRLNLSGRRREFALHVLELAKVEERRDAADAVCNRRRSIVST